MWRRVTEGPKRAYTICYDLGVKKPARTTQYTIRGVPAELERTLRRKAKLRKLSLNEVVLDELAVATGATLKKADFSDLAGQWTPDPAFDEIIATQRRIDERKWK